MSRNSTKNSLSNSDCNTAAVGALSLLGTVVSFGHNNNKNHINIKTNSFETLPPPLPPPPLPIINHIDNDKFIIKNRQTIDNDNIIKFDKNIFKRNFLLRQFLRNSQTTAAINASTNNNDIKFKFPIYENLCTGCGYGVFDSNGNLCNFCQCIINGYFDDQLQINCNKDKFYNDIDKSNNDDSNSIYENICKKCGEFCNNSECSECFLNSISINHNKKFIDQRNVILSEKLTKSSKQNRFFHGIFDTLKRSKSIHQHKIKNCSRDKSQNNSNNSSLVSKSISAVVLPKPPSKQIITSSSSSTLSPRSRKLEIIHNVDGFDNVFHTKEIFDLHKISQLKNNQKLIDENQKFYNNNNNNEHKNIYGKLRKSDDHLYKSDSINTNSMKLLKHLKISSTTSKSDTYLHKIKLKKQSISSLILNKINERENRIKIFQKNFKLIKNNNKKLNFLYKAGINGQNKFIEENIIEWMTSLRHETHNYYINYMTDDDSICSIKSIPSRYNNSCCGCSFLNSVVNINYNTTIKLQNSITTMNSSNLSELESDHNISEILSDHTTISHNIQLPVAFVVDESVDSIELCSQPHKNNDSPTTTTTTKLLRKKLTNTLTETNTNELFDFKNQQMIEIFKRNLIEKQQQQQQLKLRSKRKAIYLKPDDDDQLQFYRQTNNIIDEYGNKNNLKGALLQTNNRNGICDNTESEFVSDLLSAFDSFLKRDLNPIQSNNNIENINNDNNYNNPDVKLINNIDDHLIKGCEKIQKNFNNLIKLPEIKVSNKQLLLINTSNFHKLINLLNLSKSLNKIIIFYDNNLRIFLHVIRHNKNFLIYTNNDLLNIYKKFRKFLKNYYKNKKMFLDNTKKLENNQYNNIKILEKTEETTTTMVDNKQLIIKRPIIRVTRPAPPPPPPTRSIHTKITTTNNTKENQNNITKKLIPFPIPTIRVTKQNDEQTQKQLNLLIDENKSMNKVLVMEEDENIYQPIWKFQTIGNPRDTNDNYDAFTKIQNEEASNNVTSNESLVLVEDDHGEWETDDEFMFTKKVKNINNNNDNNQYVNINDNNNKELNEDSISLISSTVSTLTGLSISAMSVIGATAGIEDDLISKFSNNSYISNHNTTPDSLYRSICVLYSPIELKLRAILYNYNRDKFNHISSYKNWPAISKNNDKLLDDKSKNANMTKDLANSTIKMMQHEIVCSTTNNNNNVESSLKNVENTNKMKVDEGDGGECCGNNNKETFFLPYCVQAWKFMLLDISLMDDEEDIYISNDELLQLNEIHAEDKILKLKDIDLDIQSTILPSSYQRPLFKSASSDNLLDIPLQDKKSIGEKFRNKLSRGVLKLNSKQSKDTKKIKQSPQIYRRSLYLDDSIGIKYPIFGVRLDEVEMSRIDSNVPLFVVDCIQLIEDKDSIEIDGLYRQSGNKTAIDDFKKKLTENYIFNSTLLKNEDIHTITGLLKSFFRELKTGIIPTKSYEELPDILTKPENLSIIKDILNNIPNPSKGLLKYLLKHLTKVASHSQENRMPASNLAIIWGPCILMSETTGPMDIARINTLMKILIDNYNLIFNSDE